MQKIDILSMVHQTLKQTESSMSVASRNMSLNNVAGASPLRLKKQQGKTGFLGALQKTNGAHLSSVSHQKMGDLPTEVVRDNPPTLNGNTINVDQEMMVFRDNYTKSLAAQELYAHFNKQMRTVINFSGR